MMVASLSKITYGQEMTDSLYNTIKKDDVKKLSLLITKENINTCYTNTFNTTISETIKLGAVKCFEFLLRKGADVNKGCGYKEPLYFVCKYGNLEMLLKLIKRGANIDPPKYEGKYTLLEYAQKYNNEPIIKYLKSLKK